jgi:hypothetical protein
MIRREDLPEDAADWKSVTVAFDRLEPDREDTCPEDRDEIREYAGMESADTDPAEDAALKFLRTARVGDASYWLWAYTESEGTVCFVAFRKNDDGSTCLGLAEPNGLSAEQYLLADYYGEVYWS